MSGGINPADDPEVTRKFRELLEAEDVTVNVHEHGWNATNQKPSKYGRWVKQGNTFTFRLNKKGKHRIARRGEL